MNEYFTTTSPKLWQRKSERPFILNSHIDITFFGFHLNRLPIGLWSIMREFFKGPAPVRTAKLSLVLISMPLLCMAGCIICGVECLRDKIRGIALERRSRVETVKKESPAPLPIRKRTLTSPLPTPEKSLLHVRRKQRTVDQLQSTFFASLPLEIRETIYEYALTAMHTHIFRRTDCRLGHWQCHSRHRKLHDPAPGHLCYFDCKSSSGAFIPEKMSEGNIGNILPLLRTCRRVYSEAIHILYRKNTFCFQDKTTIEYFSKTTLPCRMKIIERLQLYWASSGYKGGFLIKQGMPVGEIISSMSNLRSLHTVSTTQGTETDTFQECLRCVTDADITVTIPKGDDIALTIS